MARNLVLIVGGILTTIGSICSIHGWFTGRANDLKYEQFVGAVWALACACAWTYARLK